MIAVPAIGIRLASQSGRPNGRAYPNGGVCSRIAALRQRGLQRALNGLEHARGTPGTFGGCYRRRNDADVADLGAQTRRGLALAEGNAAAVGEFHEAVHLTAMALEHIFCAFGETGRQPAGFTHGLVLPWLHSRGRTFRFVDRFGGCSELYPLSTGYRMLFGQPIGLPKPWANAH